MAMRSAVFVTVLLLLATPTYAGVGPAYAACVAAVCAAGGATTGGIACVLAAAGCASFDVQTTVTTRNGTTPLADVRAGDDVLTQAPDGVDFYTKVRRVDYVPGNFSFVTVTLDGPDGPEVTVTDHHAMMTLHQHDFSVQWASSIVIGQSMATEWSAHGTVSGVTASIRHGKYALATDDCTIFANGVLMTTDCEDEHKSQDLLSHMPEQQRDFVPDFATLLQQVEVV